MAQSGRYFKGDETNGKQNILLFDVNGFSFLSFNLLDLFKIVLFIVSKRVSDPG